MLCALFHKGNFQHSRYDVRDTTILAKDLSLITQFFFVLMKLKTTGTPACSFCIPTPPVMAFLSFASTTLVWQSELIQFQVLEEN